MVRHTLSAVAVDTVVCIIKTHFIVHVRARTHTLLALVRDPLCPSRSCVFSLL